MAEDSETESGQRCRRKEFLPDFDRRYAKISWQLFTVTPDQSCAERMAGQSK